MFYKILFENPLEYDSLESITDESGISIETQINQYTSLDSVIYSNSQIDLLMNDEGEIEGLQICNECTKTFNIEKHLLSVAYQLIYKNDITAEVFDGRGYTEIMDAESLLDYSQS